MPCESTRRSRAGGVDLTFGLKWSNAARVVSQRDTYGTVPCGMVSLVSTSLAVALIGVVGALAGVLATQVFVASREWRGRRLDALIAVIAACDRVIGAHERLAVQLKPGIKPAPDRSLIDEAYTGRNQARAAWRSARAGAEIVVPDNVKLHDALGQFGMQDSRSGDWLRAHEAGAIPSSEIVQLQNSAWEGMREARAQIRDAAKYRADLDAHWWRRWRA